MQGSNTWPSTSDANDDEAGSSIPGFDPLKLIEAMEASDACTASFSPDQLGPAVEGSRLPDLRCRLRSTPRWRLGGGPGVPLHVGPSRQRARLRVGPSDPNPRGGLLLSSRP